MSKINLPVFTLNNFLNTEEGSRLAAKRGETSPEYKAARAEWEKSNGTDEQRNALTVERLDEAIAFRKTKHGHDLMIEGINSGNFERYEQARTGGKGYEMEQRVNAAKPVEIIDFENQQFGQLRAINEDGNLWFVAADVCKGLALGNPRQAVSRLDDDEKRNTVISSDGIRGNPNMTIVSEGGMWSLVLSSRKPEAKAFKRWITHVVIPTLRKTGRYEVPAAPISAAPTVRPSAPSPYAELAPVVISMERLCSSMVEMAGRMTTALENRATTPPLALPPAANRERAAQTHQPTKAPLPRMRTRGVAMGMLRNDEPGTAISRNAIDKFIREGKIPSVKVGNKVLINYDTLLDFLREGVAV